jgi:hypothetical protein
MDSFKALTKLYNRWLQRNRFNPLISADDLYWDYHNGEVSMNNGQLSWIRKFLDTWASAEEHEFNKSKTEQDKIGELWNEYLYKDKRSFNEYFSEEFGFTCDEDITYNQMKVLCEKLIGRKQ